LEAQLILNRNSLEFSFGRHELLAQQTASNQDNRFSAEEKGDVTTSVHHELLAFPASDALEMK
jgi:hypothetical protein